MQESRKINFDILRILAMFSVMLLHTSTFNWEREILDNNWYILNSYVTISHWGVPIFVMISGMIFLDSKKDITLKNIYSKYVKRILLAYIFWSTMYSIYNVYTYGGDFITFITNIFSGHFHLWYLIMLIGLYIITPILRGLIVNIDRRVTEYWLMLMGICTIILPLITKVSIIDTVLKSNIKNLNLNFLEGYIFYFVLGYYLNNFSINLKTRRIIYFITPVLVILSVLINNLSIVFLEKRIYLLGPFDLSSFFISMSLFLLTKYNFININLNKYNLQKIILFISKYSFSMYLVHDFINMFFYKIGFNNTLFNPLISIPTITICVFLLSLIISIILIEIYKFIKNKIFNFVNRRFIND